MKQEVMELKIYEEYKEKVEKGYFNGDSVFEQLKSGDYLKALKCEKLDKNLFESVSKKVKNEMEDGFLSEINRVPFFAKNFVSKAKYGDRVAGISINNNIISNVSTKIKMLKKVIELDVNNNQNLLEKLNFMLSKDRLKETAKERSIYL